MKVYFAALAMVLAALAWNASRDHTNPPIVPEHRLESNLRVPPEVEGILRKACADCHTYSTDWPWYSRFPPVSWAMERDVNRARSAFNLSDWSAHAGRRKGTAIGALVDACEGVKDGRMPPVSYRALHPAARLTASEVNIFCGWTGESVTEMRMVARLRR